MDWREGGLQADLYDPGGLGLKPGLILVNGVVREGRRYSDFENLAWGLSRAGFVVMVPDLLNYREFRLVADDVDILADAFRVSRGSQDRRSEQRRVLGVQRRWIAVVCRGC